MKNAFVHIGLHKTATCFLQQQIFPKLEFNYINEQEGFADLVHNITSQQGYSDKIESEKDVLISSENFSGNPFTADRLSRKEILANLRNIFKGYKMHVILSLRDQTELVTSLYRQFVHQGGTLDFKGFLKWADERSLKTDGIGFLELYKYTRLLRLLNTDFVYKFIYSYREFRKDNDKMLRQMLDFMDAGPVPEYRKKYINKGYGRAQMKAAIKINKLFRNVHNPTGKIPILTVPKINLRLTPKLLLESRLSYCISDEKYRLPNKDTKRLRKFYKDDNKVLEQKYKITL